ncbi:aspartic proteinase CDR1-like [Punica granatum]|uniref:Aspartic proteinase CDR1-like n=1 Tax=Punica granatum TaxID=22663 RepID=A0A6P8C3V6_PUNGR|nr:aspartic proteinase CDR1-like [Punica granatum]
MVTTTTWPRSLFMLLSIAQIITLSSINPTNASDTSKPQRLTAKLIHRNSIFSPYYNPNATVWELNQEALNRSREHMRYYQYRMTALRENVGLLDSSDMTLGLITSDAGVIFLASMSIGQPPIPQLLIVDTGSQICGNTSGECSQGKCTFNITYFDGTSVLGNIASEQLLFETTDGGKIPVPIHVFGCANTISGPSNSQESGLLGLGLSRFSLIRQLGGKLSHCFGDIHDPKYEHNMLVFGEGAVLEGDVTPLDTSRRLYSVSMEGISVGDEKLNIDPSIFKSQTLGDGGVVIDTGSTFSVLAKGGYELLHEKVQSVLDPSLQRITYSQEPGLLCYKGQVDWELTGFPAVSFHLAQGADIVLDTSSMFRQMESDIFCMAIEPSNDEMSNLSIIGNLALQSYNVGYDIDGGKMYVQRIDCELLHS